jgi:hypothetical protein
MARSKLTFGGLVVAAALVVGVPASAADYAWSFTTAGGSKIAQGTLITDTAVNQFGNVTKISGEVNGVTIKNVVALGTVDPLFTFDNTIAPEAPPSISQPGLLFNDIDLTEYNLYTDSSGDFHLDLGNPVAGGGYVYGDNYVGTFAIAPMDATGVPEPAFWALMLTGFFGVGTMIRATRRLSAAV